MPKALEMAQTRFRRTTLTKALALGLALTLSLSAPGDGVAAESVKIVGIGSSSCPIFTKDVVRSLEQEKNYFAWAQGYMSGLLIRAPDGKDEGLDLMPRTFSLNQQAAFLREYCIDHRDQDFIDAVNSLYRTLRAPSD